MPSWPCAAVLCVLLCALRAAQVGSVDSILSTVPMRTIAEVLQDKYGRLPAEDTPE